MAITSEAMKFNEMVQWGPIGQEVFLRTYARTKEDGTKESWKETVTRVVDGNCALSPIDVSIEERESLFDLIYNFKIMPAGRHLWVSGVEGRQYLFNCHRAGWGTNLDNHFTFLFYQLMCGGGVGTNYSTAPTYRVPDNPGTLYICCNDHPDLDEFAQYINTWTPSITYKVVDSKEGWCVALQQAIVAIMNGWSITFDINDIRARGVPLKKFGGTSSGPASFVKMLRNIESLLHKRAGFDLDGLWII